MLRGNDGNWYAEVNKLPDVGDTVIITETAYKHGEFYQKGDVGAVVEDNHPFYDEIKVRFIKPNDVVEYWWVGEFNGKSKAVVVEKYPLD